MVLTFNVAGGERSSRGPIDTSGADEGRSPTSEKCCSIHDGNLQRGCSILRPAETASLPECKVEARMSDLLFCCVLLKNSERSALHYVVKLFRKEAARPLS